MQNAIRFIKEGYKQIAILKEADNSLTELVLDSGNAVFVRKTIPYTGLPYRQLQKLCHPLFPKIYYVAEDEEKTYVIEQHLDGQNLQDVLEQKGYLPEQQVRKIALQLCDGLEYLHANQIIHRDIKPSNIILQEDGTVRLIDFGAARIADSSVTQDTRILGTPGYAPPEQYGFAATDYRSDYYALGMTLQTLLGNQHRRSITRAIRRCVELDPERRISSAEELRKLLQSHWYDFFLAERKVLPVLMLILCILLGGILWWYMNKDSNMAVETDTKIETQEVKAKQTNDKELGENKGQEKKPNVQYKKDEMTVKNQNEKQTQEINKATVEKAETPPATPIKPEKPILSKSTADAVQFRGNNWSGFQRTEQRLGPVVKGADKVNYPTGQWPQIMLENNSDVPLQNPKIVLYFTDFGVLGNNFSTSSWGGRTESITYAGKAANGIARQVTLQLTGTVPPHDSHPLQLFGGVTGFYKTGANPSVYMVFTADNAPKKEKSIAIGIK